MKKDVITKLHQRFEDLVQHDPESNGEYWLARDLQELLGYAKWENFAKVIEKAKTSCKRNAARSSGDSEPRTTMRAISTSSASSIASSASFSE